MYPWPFGEFDNVMDDALNSRWTISYARGKPSKIQGDADYRSECHYIGVALWSEEPGTAWRVLSSP
jgi:hypothetical protein